MRKLKAFFAAFVMAITLAFALPAKAGDGNSENPGIEGNSENPGVTGNSENPGITIFTVNGITVVLPF